MSILRCAICFNDIGTFYANTITLPLKSDDFKPLQNGYAAPFPEGFLWGDMRCPICHCNPFAPDEKLITGWISKKNEGPNKVLTPNGYVLVGNKKSFICPVCDKPCKTQNGLAGHMKAHKTQKAKRRIAANG